MKSYDKKERHNEFHDEHGCPILLTVLKRLETFVAIVYCTVRHYLQFWLVEKRSTEERIIIIIII